MWKSRLAIATTRVLLTRSMWYIRSGVSWEACWGFSARESNTRIVLSHEPEMSASQVVDVNNETDRRDVKRLTSFFSVYQARDSIRMWSYNIGLFASKIKAKERSVMLNQNQIQAHCRTDVSSPPLNPCSASEKQQANTAARWSNLHFCSLDFPPERSSPTS